MADDRAAEDLIEQVARQQREIDDLRSTVLVRVSRRPTGSVEPTFAATAPADTLLLQGQTLNRVDFPALWQWAVDHGAVTSSAFGPGNGSTTFTLPDLRGRVPIGAGTGAGDTYALGDLDGAATRALVTGNLPAHDHNVSGSLSGASAAGGGAHSHGGSTSTTGAHTIHPEFGIPVAAGSGATAWSGGSVSAGGHSHTITSDTEAAHTHTVSGSVSITESLIGSGTAFDVRQASIAWNWLIYT